MPSAASPKQQPNSDVGSSPADAAAAAAAEGAARSDAAPDAASAAPAKPADTTGKLADIEKAWAAMVERVTEHVDAAEQRLQQQLADASQPGWQPPPYECSGPNVTSRASAAGVALSWWQHSDRCLSAALIRAGDVETMQDYKIKMRKQLARLTAEHEEATAAAAAAEAGGEQAAAGGQDAAGAASPDGAASPAASAAAGTSAPASAAALSPSEIAKRSSLLGGLAASAARTDALLDRTAALAAQAQELCNAAKRTAADKLAAYLREALGAEATRQQRREEPAGSAQQHLHERLVAGAAQQRWRDGLAAPPPLAYPAAGGYDLRAAPLAGHGAQLFGARGAPPLGGLGAQAFAGLDARPYGGFGAQPFGGHSAQPFGGHGAQPFGGVGAQPFGGHGLQPAGYGAARPQGAIDARWLAQARGAAAAAGMQRRPAQEERPPAWAPPDERELVAASAHYRCARLRAMLDSEEQEGEEAEEGGASQEGSEGEEGSEGAAAEEGSEWEAAEEDSEGEAAEERPLQTQQGCPASAAELAPEPSMPSPTSCSSAGAAAEAHSGSQEEREEMDAVGAALVLTQMMQKRQGGQEAPAVDEPDAEAQRAAGAQAGPAAVASSGQLAVQQHAYVEAQRRRFAEAKQAGEAPPGARAFPPPASQPPSWQPRLPLASRSVLPPAVEAARAAAEQEGIKGRAGAAGPAYGLENRQAKLGREGWIISCWDAGLQCSCSCFQPDSLCPLPLNIRGSHACAATQPVRRSHHSPQSMTPQVSHCFWPEPVQLWHGRRVGPPLHPAPRRRQQLEPGRWVAQQLRRRLLRHCGELEASAEGA